MPDVAAIDKLFDYRVPEELSTLVRIGTRVRVRLGARRVRGWVVGEGVVPPPGVVLRPLSGVSGWGPPAEVVDLATWAAWRWAGPAASFMRTASPDRVVSSLPSPSALRRSSHHDPVPSEAFGRARSVVRVAPATDTFPYVQQAARTLALNSQGVAPGARGAPPSALVLAPSQVMAGDLAARLVRIGHPVALLPRDWDRAASGGAVVIGTRSAAWAPAPRLSAILVLDAHDEAYQEERAPTWSVWVVAGERARRDGAPCVLVSPCPSLDLLSWGPLVLTSRDEERQGWPPIEVVDRRAEDPRHGVTSDRLVRILRGARADRPVVCVLNRKGRAQLLACARCGELARCGRCDGPLAQPAGEDALRCRRCGEKRPVVCAVLRFSTDEDSSTGCLEGSRGAGGHRKSACGPAGHEGHDQP